MIRILVFLLACLVVTSAGARNPRGMGTGTGTPATNVWTNVTPSGPDLSNPNLCGSPGNFGTQTVGHDSASPNIMYAAFDYFGIYKSTDYGATWAGPINTGTLGSTISASCGAGITVGSGGVIYFSAIRGTIGLFKSTDGGVDWVQENVAGLPSGRQDCYPPQIDPYNASHLIMPGHEQNVLVESVDAGVTWTVIPTATTGGPSGNGMQDATGGTGFVFFINTGSSTTTATTFLWIAQWNNNTYGTWRTTNDGTSWTFVQNNEHAHGASQIYQPNTTGDLFMAGLGSSLGSGALHSSDYGVTWGLAGTSQNESLVWGTSKHLWTMYGWAIGLGQAVGAQCQMTATVPSAGSAGTWSSCTVPSGIYQGAGRVDVNNDGTHNILVGAMWGAGIWRLIEP